MTEIVTTESNQVQKQPANDLETKLRAARNTLMPGADEGDFLLFLEYCQRTKLDPFSRQIYAVGRNTRLPNGSYGTRYTIQTSIDGFRVIAERSGNYAGQTPYYWCGADGVWTDVWTSKSFPVAAKVGVLRKGFSDPVWEVALFKEFCQVVKGGQPNKMWSKMPTVMLAKCAESKALRRAFPNAYGGLYTSEEMGQADNPDGIQFGDLPATPPEKPVKYDSEPAIETEVSKPWSPSESQIKRFWALFNASGVKREKVDEYLKGRSIESVKELTREQYDEMCERFQLRIKQANGEVPEEKPQPKKKERVKHPGAGDVRFKLETPVESPPQEAPAFTVDDVPFN